MKEEATLVLEELVSNILSIPRVLKGDVFYTLVGSLVGINDIVVDSNNGDISSTSGNQVAILLLHSSEEVLWSSFKGVVEKGGGNRGQNFASDRLLRISLTGHNQGNGAVA